MKLLRSIVDKTQLEVRHAFRALRRTPGFTLAAILVLALGVGANAAIFTLVDAVLLKPMPYHNPDSLVMVWHTPPQAAFPGVKQFPASPANFLDWEKRQRSFETMAVIRTTSMVRSGRGEPEPLQVSAVSPVFFGLLGITMEAGRGFQRTEGEVGQHRVAVLSNATWKTRFGGDPSVIGQTTLLDDTPYTIVGVMDAAFDQPFTAQIWVPLAWSPQERAIRFAHNVLVVARLAPGVDISKARVDMNAIASALEREYPEDNKGWGATVVPLQELFTGDMRPLLLVLLGAVGFVLLIACANVTNLIFVRSLAKRSEMAVRLALGAGPWRIARYVLTETTLLGLGAGIVGLAIGNAGVRLLVFFLAERLPKTFTVQPGTNVLLFTIGISLITGLAAGLWPALRLARASLVEAIKEGGDRGDSDASGSKTRGVLIIAEVALSLMLLIGAGLMIRTIWELNKVDAGFDPHNVVVANLSLPSTQYRQAEKRLRFFEDVVARVGALPDVESVGLVRTVPLRGAALMNTWPVAVIGRPPVPVGEQPNIHGNVVSPEFFATLKIPLVRGRGLTDADRLGSPPVVVISDAMAKWLWPNEDPIGQRVFLAFMPGEREVVGIVANTKEEGLTNAGSAALYIPYAQMPVPAITLVVRAKTATPMAIVPALTNTVKAIDNERTLLEIMPMDTIVEQSFANRRATMSLLVVFASLALVLAAVGLYSVLAYGVRRRIREIGIRIALGSGRGVVTRMVVADAMRPTLIGIALGLVGALLMRKVMASFIFGVSAGDPLTFVTVAGLFIAVALCASALPAYWAARVDPIVTLRAE